ncbi:MAG TPA: AmmeMemoRadiSam system radical SAM enzyme [Acidobacteriota bacterium]|nr:AmmeMemoRadiSam system radical SAM enzyme [Acidobacteriota bacterium]
MKERHPARYQRREGDLIICALCPHMCRLSEGERGICRGRMVIDGELIAVNYGLTPSLSIDPIEKKPLYHFHPGQPILSLGPAGCNFRCEFCQNWQISQTDFPTHEVDPQSLLSYAREGGAIGISYTYTEPLIWFEFIYDCASAFREAGFKNVMVSNGYVNPEPLAELLPLIDAWNIDLKSIRPEFYRRLSGGTLEPVLKTIEAVNRVALVELTNLVIPGENDSEEDLRDLVAWVADLDRSIPLHFSRYHPDYKSSHPPTPASTLEAAYRIGRERLDYVYVGNIFIRGTDTTWCPNCGKAVIERSGFGIRAIQLEVDRCAHCGHQCRIVR